MATAAVNQFLTETTVHGLVHFTGERRMYIKIIWLVAVLASLFYCGFRVSDVCNKYASKDATTTVQTNALEFEFPDIYICNEHSMSGSFSVTLNDRDSNILSHYRRIVKRSVSTMTFKNTEVALDSYAVRLINTLPIQFLSDKMGHQLSSILYFYLDDDGDVRGVIHHHPFYLNCFNLNLTDKDRNTLRNPSNVAQVIMFLDPQLPPPFDNSTEKDIWPYEKATIDLKPIDWDFNYGTDFTTSSGFRVFLTPKGQYPSDFEKQLTLGSSQQHRVSIKMEETVYNENDFAGKCEGNTAATADFVDPYSGKKQTFKYSHAVCWYREIARLSIEKFNCTVWRMPIPWEYRPWPSCFNVTMMSSNVTFDTKINRQRAQIIDLGRRACENKVPCRSRKYTYEYSSSSWPSNRIWEQFLQRFITHSKVENKESPVPGIEYLVYNATTDKVRRSLVQLTVSSAERMSSAIQLALAYSFSSLIADVGGLLGLFLGASLLSVLELVELLHDCALCAFEWFMRRRSVTEATEM